jgi:hypothetical protein
MMETRLGRRTSSDFGDPKKLIPEARKESLTKYERYPQKKSEVKVAVTKSAF